MRPFRFGLGRNLAADRVECIDRVRQVETIGYPALLVPAGWWNGRQAAEREPA